MTMRDNFPPKVIEEMRKRAGGRCSAPNCRAPTTGPSQSRSSGVTSVGVAAHITAAAPGGPRFDPNLRPAERRSSENAIWVCQTHGKQIDDDERRYTADLLRSWRKHAEYLAGVELGRPTVPVGKPDLIRHRATVAAVGLRQGTADFLEDIAASAVWGKRRSEVVRMMLYELALNATTHGSAAEVTLWSEPGCIGLSYSGPQFGLTDLLRSDQRGGGDAVRALKNEASGLLDLNYRYQDSRSEWFILDHTQTGASDDPCGIQLLPTRNSLEASLAAVADCHEIHVYADGRWSFSDVHNLHFGIQQYLAGRQFVVHGIDPDGPLANRLHELLPRVRFTDPGNS
jgi:hypothetical protein